MEHPVHVFFLIKFFFSHSFKAYQNVQQQLEQEEQSLRIPRDVSKEPEEMSKVRCFIKKKKNSHF